MLSYGNTAVPWGVMWTGEDEFFIGECPYFHRPAICQKEAQGQGTPIFGRPHAQRHRKLQALGLCDLCAKPLKNHTKISLGQCDPSLSHNGGLIELEPLLHSECALLSLRYCPALKKQMSEDRIQVRQVFKCRAFPLEGMDYEGYVPDYNGPPFIGLAALELHKWQDVTQSWKQRIAG